MSGSRVVAPGGRVGQGYAALQTTGERPDARPSPVDPESFDADALGIDLDAVDDDTVLDDDPVQPNRDSEAALHEVPER